MIKKLKNHLFLVFSVVSLFLLFLGILQFLVVFSRPGEPSYALKKTWENLRVALSSSDLEKASIHLSSSNNLLMDFTNTFHANPNDSRLIPIAKELVYQEDQAIFHMTKAKNGGLSVKTEAVILCEVLEKQHDILRLSVTKSPDEIKKYLDLAQNTTSVNLKKSMAWE